MILPVSYKAIDFTVSLSFWKARKYCHLCYILWPLHIICHYTELNVICQYVGGNDCKEGTKMGKAPGEKHFLLRWTRNDGPAERRLLSNRISHRRHLLPVLRIRVSRSVYPLFIWAMIKQASKLSKWRFPRCVKCFLEWGIFRAASPMKLITCSRPKYSLYLPCTKLWIKW